MEEKEGKKADPGQEAHETKSISTGASMENVFFNFSGPESNMYSQNTFKCEESHTFCKNVPIV